MYYDGYGGQNSMGTESYQGAVEGFVFVCPSSGTIKVKLYATTKQFPAILYQVLQEVETEGYVCREMYFDTLKVNFSAAAEEVAAMFKVRLVPVSSGTPQEVAYAESAVRTIAAMSRCMMAGAPHLPKCCWGLSDRQAANIHEVMPQKSKGNISPYEHKTKRRPDRDALFIRVFGCPAQYEPWGGALQKRASKTEWGYFVGMQWPMVLIMRPEDWKVISVSRKKVLCHEERYATSDSVSLQNSIADFTRIKADLEAIKGEKEGLQKIASFKQTFNIPDHVLSVKSLDDYKRNEEMNEATPTDPPRQITETFEPHPAFQGEYRAEHDSASVELLMEEIRSVKERIKAMDAREGQAEAMLRALNVLEQEIHNQAPRKGNLKKKKKAQSSEVDGGNVQTYPRRKAISWNLVGIDKPTPESAERVMRKRRHGDQGCVVDNEKSLETGDRVKILTKMFGPKYALGREKYSYGKVVSAKGNMINVLYDEDNVEWRSHITHLTKISMMATEERAVIAAGTSRPIFEAYINGGVRVRTNWVDRKCVDAGWFRGSSTSHTILPVLEMNSKLTNEERRRRAWKLAARFLASHGES
jgi:hypothetical protein